MADHTLEKKSAAKSENSRNGDAAVDDTTNGSKANGEDTVTLDTQFFYQNRTTGQASQMPLTTRQICRLVCPAVGGKQPLHTALTPSTQVLRVSSDGSYGTKWRQAKDIPVVRHAVESWHYEEKPGATTGPVNCRELSNKFYDATDGGVSLKTRVYSPISKEWKAIQDMPELQIALESLLVDPVLSNETEKDAQNEAHAHRKELEEFLSSTANMGPQHSAIDSDDDASYRSDQGTRYVKDPFSGNWIHEALVPTTAKRKTEEANSNGQPSKKKRNKKAKFSAKNARCWIYVNGLPKDTNESEVAQVFAKAGILDLDPETQRPKIKLYRHKTEGSPEFGQCKGDASLCYARPESVDLAITLLDETTFRSSTTCSDDTKMRVERAKFEQRGDHFDASRNRVSNAKRKVAKLAAIQARDWDEGEFNGRLTGGRKGLRIIVVKGVFHPSAGQLEDDDFFEKLEQDMRSECEQWGAVEKITVFARHPEGVVIVKFVQPGSASAAVKGLEGRQWNDVRTLRASFWDGVTDYTVCDEAQEKEETEKRQQEFGNWLESQTLPEELRLQKE